MEAIGKRRWAIAGGYLPSWSHGPEALESHETACILNASGQEARIEVTVLFADREPLGPFVVKVAPRRTLHLRFDELGDRAIPRDTDYASVIESDVPIVVQHTRLDSRQDANALLTTIAWGE